MASDFHPSSKIVPRAIVLQVVEGGEVDVHHATLIWDLVLPSGKTIQQHSPVDDVLGPNIESARKMLVEAVREIRKQQAF